MATETLNFKISLRATKWNKNPKFSVLINNDIVVNSYLVDEDLHHFEFSYNFDEGPHNLRIRLENKTPHDTIKDANDNIDKDMLLNIEKIEIDDVDLGTLMWTADYILDEPQAYNGEIITNLPNCVNLGWNGTYQLSFNSPFYIWLLENI